MTKKVKPSIAVMTSGGDAPGMNAAVRAVVRAGIANGFNVYAIYEGYQGLVENIIKPMRWEDVSGILDRGGTVIGTARSKEFRERSGLLKAAENLHKNGINKLVVIGGDGSLSGADELRAEWESLQAELLKSKRITAEEAKFSKDLALVGLVGSIDNDMAETEMTIGVDSALHRIVESVDELRSTAYSHQRTFVVEVMGRNCGYLALMAGIATGASVVFTPEITLQPDWKKRLCVLLDAGRKVGRRDNIVLVAEGTRDLDGNRLTAVDIQHAIEEGLDIEARVTILGHVQRGGSPSAFDRYMATAAGCKAVETLMNMTEQSESMMVALRGNRIVTVPLMEAVARTRTTAKAVKEGDSILAEELRGGSWTQAREILRTLCLAVPSPEIAKAKSKGKKDTDSIAGRRIGILTCGWPSPGMNSAIRTATRLIMDSGSTAVAVENGVEGLVESNYRDLCWMEVEEWISEGGSNIGANRRLPESKDLYQIARTLEDAQLDGLLVIGGWSGYVLVDTLYKARRNYASFNIPMVCIPSTISNNLPGSELSIGADTALNTITEAIDRVKHSADSSRRLFIVEVMGRYCGYLAVMSGIATGAEFIYLHERGVSVKMMQEDLGKMQDSFTNRERKVALMIRNENANPTYSIDFMSSLFEEEGGNMFDIRKVVLGPVQQGGSPSPFDRIQATRLSYNGVMALMKLVSSGENICGFVGQNSGRYSFHEWYELERLVEERFRRPKRQWWQDIYELNQLVSFPPADHSVTEDHE